MNDVSAHSHGEMTYWKAWFHFWVKSFPGGMFTRDDVNPTFYYSEKRHWIRVTIHSIILGLLIFFTAILFSIFVQPVNAQTPPQYYPGGYAPIGSPPPDPGNPYTAPSYGDSGSSGPINSNPPPPSACTIFLSDKYSTQNAYVYSDDPHTVYSGGIPQHPECEDSSTWYPDTGCEWTAIAGGLLGVGEILVGLGFTPLTGGGSNVVTYFGAGSIGVAGLAYSSCDGRW